jgi:hypothetical protein
VDGLTERSWPGHCLRIGDVVIGVQDLRGRCINAGYRATRSRQHSSSRSCHARR